MCQRLNIEITYSGPDQLVVDEGAFFRLLHNLAGNAKSVGADKLEITVWRAGQLAIINIADNGPGMMQQHGLICSSRFPGQPGAAAGRSFDCP